MRLSDFIIRFLSLNGLLDVITGAFDRLEELADKVSEKIEKVDQKIVDVRVFKNIKVSDARIVADRAIYKAEQYALTTTTELEVKARTLSSEENKARTLAKNWKKVMLDNIS